MNTVITMAGEVSEDRECGHINGDPAGCDCG